MCAASEPCGVAFGLAGEGDFQQVLDICSGGRLRRLDYMGAVFHRWLQEPGRLVFIGRIQQRVVALESALLVDGGQTVVVQGLRVVPDLRGRGIAGALRKHVIAQVRQHYPEVCAIRLTRGQAPTPETLTKYRLIAKEAILSLCCEAAHLGPFIAELRSKLAR
ncbi:histidine N-acetyltransferase-like [Salarias fasciatus]|uniref:histidine N-acetyltransferase-like n=1 Tax=Salarias fasciatus TaxID=181472 RepID=UPI0011768097|nr:histidine N-acetyltransferase-like [Salarias fasciatus]